MHALLFELDSVQDFIFASGRLRDVAGASELLDRLTNREAEDNLLDAVCRALDIQVVEGNPSGEEVAFSRRAGGAFYAFSEDRDTLERLRDLWTLGLQQAVPHLAYSLGLGAGDTAAKAFRNARDALREDASRLRPALPAAVPVAERSRRTGLPAVQFGKEKDGAMDAATVVRKRFSNPAGNHTAFLDRFEPDSEDLKWDDWPFDLEPEESENSDSKHAFPFQGESRILALVHADGNGLGLILQALDQAAARRPEAFIPLYTAFSLLVERVTCAAARAATAQVLLPARDREGTTCLPARPILLGGDDITLLVRADLAMDYIRVFTKTFEDESRKALEALKEEHELGEGLPPRLTLGIGLVYLRASQPFRMAVRLAESLTKTAKQAAKEKNKDDPPSSIAFHRVTASLIEDYDALVDQTLTHRHGEKVFVDTLGAYLLGEGEAAPRLEDLLELAKLLGAEDMARGPTRTLLTLMGQSLGEAKSRYRRWRQVMKDGHGKKLQAFDDLMARLAGIDKDDLPYGKSDPERRSPLGDALALLGAGHAIKKKKDKEAA